jgi:photosystem II stability/assembly factor-like uncharacterized protein
MKSPKHGRTSTLVTMSLLAAAAAAWLASLVCAPPLAAQPFDQRLFGEMRWRSIGPYRAGRTRAVAGVPSQPNVFYMGVCNGGVWKTTDYGRTWRPIFDDQPTGSVGAIAVSPSDPDVIYVASGEGLQRPDLSVGDGIYKSTDAGKTWTHLGLRDGQQIPQIIVDPRDPDRVFAAVLGHPYGPNEERGIYRSLDGGRTFDRVLSVDENTGGSEVAFDPSNPAVVYAGLWESREGPWENAAWSGTKGGLYKSTDGGTTWGELKLVPAAGVPSGSAGAASGAPEAIVQINLGIAPSEPRRIYAAVALVRGTALYRSDDAGATWTRLPDTRPAGRIGGGDLPRIAVHPTDPDTLFVAATVSYKSTDGGRTFRAFKGAPGGDDYQNIWINPTNPAILLYASDQGACITVNGGETWSSWYNQPTAQLYHVAADNAFPYRVYSGQQESGSAGVASRGDDGRITFREWRPVGVDEYGYAAPDPLDPDIVYGGRGVTRWDRRTDQVQTVGPRVSRGGPGWRTVRTQPVLFSPIDPHTLFFAANTLWKTRDGGQSWTQISPDLTRKTWDVPASVGKYRDEPTAKPAQRGVIYAVAPSYVDAMTIWAGTDDGLIQVTTDGGLHWTDVTPPQLVPWAKVSVMDAGRFDAKTAYAAVNTLRLDDLRPHIYRTHDGGKTWTEIVNGIPAGAPTNAVREDPVRRGLLFAATEREVFVSFDDGGHWQSLRLNMAPSSVRDIIVKDDDLVAATHGRGFWILDDVAPLRGLDAAAAAGAVLFKPQVATRVRYSMNTDTPLPPDEPGGENPPDGAIIDYALAADAAGPVTLEIVNGAGRVVRRYSSDDKPAELPTPESAAVPLYWYRKPLFLQKTTGHHRFLWDMRYQPLDMAGGRGRGGLPMTAVPYNTVPAPNSIWAPPGIYKVRLTVDGKAFEQPLTLRLDPRVKTPAAGLAKLTEMSVALYDGILESQQALKDLRKMRAENKKMRDEAEAAGKPAEALAAFEAFEKKAAALEGGMGAAGGAGGPGGPMGGPGMGPGGAGPIPDTLMNIGPSLNSLMTTLQGSETTPTDQLAAAVNERLASLRALLDGLKALKGTVPQK